MMFLSRRVGVCLGAVVLAASATVIAPEVGAAPIVAGQADVNTQPVKWILKTSSNVAADIKKLLITNPSAMTAVIAIVKEGGLSPEVLTAISSGINLARAQLTASGQAASAGQIYALQVSDPALAAGAVATAIAPAVQAQNANVATDGTPPSGSDPAADPAGDQAGPSGSSAPVTVTDPQMAVIPNPSAPPPPLPPPPGNVATNTGVLPPSSSGTGGTGSGGTSSNSNSNYSSSTSSAAAAPPPPPPPPPPGTQSVFSPPPSALAPPPSNALADSPLSVTTQLVGSPSPPVSPSQ